MNFSAYSRLLMSFVFLSLSAFVVETACANESRTKSTQKSKKHKAVAEPEAIGEFANFGQWTEVDQFMDMMVAKHGFNKTEMETVFRKIRHIDTAIQLMKPAPADKPKNWQAYRARFIEPVRITAGIKFWDKHETDLARAEMEYGVPAEIIVGILGVETLYGRHAGKFRVLDALTTLGFDYPNTPTRTARMLFFRGELENTLLFARESGIDPFTLLGSYAGAIGWPQFMPSSIRQYAVDFDGDSRIDLRNSPADAVGSIANFLTLHGWKRGEAIVFPATVSRPNPDGTTSAWNAYIGRELSAKFNLDELRNAGVTPGMELPPDMTFGLVDLQNGLEPTEYWLGAANFFAITHYNRSFFYAMSVIELGRAVRVSRERKMVTACGRTCQP